MNHINKTEMEIFLKRKADMFWGEIEEFECYIKQGKQTRIMIITIDPFADSYTIQTELRKQHIDIVSREAIRLTKREKSNKAEFMEAYKNAKNSIKTFADQLIMK